MSVDTKKNCQAAWACGAPRACLANVKKEQVRTP